LTVNAPPDLAAGSSIIINANIFIYAFDGRSQQCRALLTRCASEAVVGITTAEVINEVCHRLMLAEAVAKGALPRPSAASLKRKPQVVRRLEQYWSRVVAIFDLNIIVLPLDEARIRRAHEIRAIYGLLTNDSLLVAAALEFEIDSIATRDDDFDRVAQLRIYKPSDVF